MNELFEDYWIDDNGWLYSNANQIIIPDPYLTVNWNSKIKKHYELLGYTYTKMGDPLSVFVPDLTDGSRYRVGVYCPDCENPRTQLWYALIRDGNTFCNSCASSRAKTLDLTKLKFGKLSPKRIVGKDKWGAALWECLCDCGNTTIVPVGALTKGNTRSCGCLIHEDKFENLKGRHFDSLTVLEYAGKNRWGAVLWECQCKCGNKLIVTSGALTGRHTTSCGKGVCHYNYNPNLSDEDRGQRRRYPGYDNWRDSVYLRDNYTCQACGIKSSGNLNAHHLKDHSTYPEYRIDINNGVTMCVSCHREFHIDYMGNWNISCTEEDYYNWLKLKVAIS